MSFRVCIACYGIRVYPYMGFMVGQQFECQDCQERMVVPLEFDNEDDYRAFRDEMLGETKAPLKSERPSSEHDWPKRIV